jgi:ubiquinone/menaquinone biosynthesis C-methylase UbiE
MPWFRKTAPRDPLVVSMAGVKLGDRLLIVGGRDTKAVAQLAAKPGLSGRTVVVDEDPARAAAAARAAEREGALVESVAAPWNGLPMERASFDIVVVRGVLAEIPPGGRTACVREANRVLRPGGRCLVIEGRAGGLAALAGVRVGDAEYVASGGAVRALEEGGFLAVRLLARREGLVFIEGVKPNP